MSDATNVADGLRVSSGITLPLDYVTKTAAILAQRRKGKTYTGAVLAEELVRLRLPWVALDPTGAWWGLRSSADGDSPGLPVVVIGGQHGDLPLERDGGAVIADLVLDHPGWYVLDLSLLESRAAERDFSLAFAQRLYRRKMQPGMDFPLHLFVDEADLFVPQERETGQDNLVLGAFQSIVRRGGLHGLGTTLISQRPAAVNKGALTQLDLLVILRLVAGQDQDAIYRDYVKRHGTKEQQREIMDSLASLPVGEAWLWEPGAEPSLLVRVKIRERRTFNSSATPKAGEKRVEPRVLAAVDLDAIRDKMVGAIERARLDDPSALRAALADEKRRRQNAEAELHEMAEWASEVEAADDGPTAIDALIATYQVAKRNGYSLDVIDEARALAEGAREPLVTVEHLDSIWALVRSAQETGEKITTEIREVAQPLAEAILKATSAAERKTARAETAIESTPVAAVRNHDPADAPLGAAESPRERDISRTRTGAAPAGDTAAALSTGASHLLDTLAAHHPLRLTIGQLALLANRKARGGAWNSAMKKLRDGGYVEDVGGLLALTDYARTVLGVPNVPLSAGEIRDRWRHALPVAARDLFDLLVQAYPDPVSIDRLASSTGRAARGGSWNSAVATLTRNGLAVKTGDGLRATTEATGG